MHGDKVFIPEFSVYFIQPILLDERDVGIDERQFFGGRSVRSDVPERHLKEQPLRFLRNQFEYIFNAVLFEISEFGVFFLFLRLDEYPFNRFRIGLKHEFEGALRRERPCGIRSVECLYQRYAEISRMPDYGIILLVFQLVFQKIKRLDIRTAWI